MQLDHLDSRLAANLVGGNSHQVLLAHIAQISCRLGACLLGGKDHDYDCYMSSELVPSADP